MATTPRRNGFTLIELLIAMVLIAILATIGVNRFWSVRDKGLLAAIQHDIRNFASLQEEYFQKNYTYAATTATLTDYVPSPGVTLTVTHNAIDGWAATATNAAIAGRQCGYFTGNAPSATAPPATSNGVIACN